MTDKGLQHDIIGDIGGTHARFQAPKSPPLPGHLAPHITRLRCDEHASAADLILAAFPEPYFSRAVFAIAGPVFDGVGQMVNQSFRFDERALSELLGADVRVVNDFHAAALGATRPRAKTSSLKEGRPLGEGVAVVGPGTGLGAAVVRGGNVYCSEFGSTAFAPRDQAELALTQGHALRREELVAGPGLARIAAHLYAESPIGRASFSDLSSSLVSKLAEEGDDVANAAIDLWLSLLARSIRDYALSVLPLGGIRLVGDVLNAHWERLDETFIATIVGSDAQSEWLSQIPIELVSDKDLGLRGAELLLDAMSS